MCKRQLIDDGFARTYRLHRPHQELLLCSSVHLDPSNPKARATQLEGLAPAYCSVRADYILVGGFNCNPLNSVVALRRNMGPDETRWFGFAP